MLVPRGRYFGVGKPPGYDGLVVVLGSAGDLGASTANPWAGTGLVRAAGTSSGAA